MAAFQRELTFAPDRRSMDGGYYQFDRLAPGAINVDGVYHQGSYKDILTNIYTEKYRNIVSPGRVEELVNRLINNVPLDNININYLAAANYFVDNFVNRKAVWSPEAFGTYFESMLPILMRDVTNKSPEQIQDLRLEHKLALFRYSEYILRHLRII